jgi:minor extracellular serine protease Vpr
VKARLVALFGALTLVAGSLTPALAASPQRAERSPDAATLKRLEGHRLSEVERSRDIATAKLAAELRGATGRRDVVVRLKAPAVGAVQRTPAAQRQQLSAVTRQQSAFAGRAKRLDARLQVIGRAQRVLNAVVLRVDAKQLARLAADADVVSIRPVRDYEKALDETVPYIGARAVQNLGFKGKGITVAILDSGIDYTHVAFGGPGTLAAYKAAYGNSPDDAKNRSITDTFNGKRLFPSKRVIAGYDFVGETWPEEDFLSPDPDPIDCSPSVFECDGGHGTHVADIAAGAKGVAPAADIVAIKVCSAVSTACSGAAMIQGLDFAMDPNQDGNLDDAADVVNMSIGSDYGQSPDDDLSLAIEIVTKAGTLVVAAAGNGSDKPWISGTPAAAQSALSVAQTNVPSTVIPVLEIVSPASVAGQYEAVFQPWSKPLTAAIQAPAQYGNGTGGNLLGCDPFPAGSLAGKIVLVDRGDCNFTLKVKNISVGGGLAAVIGLVTPEEPFAGADGGDRPIDIPGYMVHQVTADQIRAGISAGGAVIRFDPNDGIPGVGIMTGSSSRGPSMVTNIIKPEIGAPGASVSAEVGTGTGTTVFGGTSGASPMVAGSAVLLRQAFPGRTPQEIKAVLVNTAETSIMSKPTLFGGDLASITRIGGGEVRVNRAIASKAAAWDKKSGAPALSFGFHDVSKRLQSVSKTVVVKNYGSSAITYAIKPTFRFANDRTNGAVRVIARSQLTVPAKGSAQFTVSVVIDGAKLRQSMLDSGITGTDPTALTLLEYDGYVNLDNVATSADNADPLHLPWQVLPRQAGDVSASPTTLSFDEGAADLTLKNAGVGPAYIDGYSLLATSPDDPRTPNGDNVADVDLRYVGVQTFYPLPATVCESRFALALATTTWDRTTHAVAPAMLEWDIDTTGDGEADYAVINAALSGPFTLDDARMLTWVVDLESGDATAFFTVDHGTNTGNMALLLCGEQLGLTEAAVGTKALEADVLGVDWYNSGTVSDAVEDVTFLPFGERYFAETVDLEPHSEETIVVDDFGPDGTNPDELGVLLFTDAARGDVRSGAPKGKEAIAVLAE